MGPLVDEQRRSQFYACLVDGAFAKANGRGAGIGCTKVGKGVKVMVLVDAKGLPLAVGTAPANSYESGQSEELLGFMLSSELSE